MRKLSELLAMYRTDRPDEWTMDEFKRAADALEAENARLRAEIDAANAQEPSWYEIHIPVNEKPDLLKSLSECHESYHAKAIRHYARPIPAQQSPAASVHGNWDEEAYKSVCDNLEQWKSRAIEAEDLLERIRNDMAPTHMGEPVISDETVNQALIAAGYARDALRYKNELDRLLQSPRITEQDFRDIGLSSLRYWIKAPNGNVDDWLENEGTFALLAKLNEKKHD